MWDEIFDLALKNGLWAVLFMGLLIFVIKDSTRREQKYQQTIKDLIDHLGIIQEIKKDIDVIKSYVNTTKKPKNSQKNEDLEQKDKKTSR